MTFFAEAAEGAVHGPAAAGSTEQLLITLLLVLPIAGFALTAMVGRRLGSRGWLIAVPRVLVTTTW